MLDYKTISEAYGLAEKTVAKKAAEPDEMDVAGVPSVKGGAADKDEGIFSKFLRNISKSREKLSKNLEKSKENLSKNVKKSEENLKKHLETSKQKLKKNLGAGEQSEGEVNKAALGKLSLGQPAKYNVKEDLNLPKSKPKMAPKAVGSEPEGQVNKAAFKDLSLGKPAKYNVKEDLNLSKSPTAPKKGVSMTDLHHKKEGNPYSMTGAHHQGGATPTTVNPESPKPTEEHKEAAQGHLQKLLGQAKKAAEEHPAAAGALGALAAGAGALGVKKLLSRKKKTA